MQKPVTVKSKQRLIRVAAGREKADLVLKDACCLDVFTESWVRGDIAIAEGKIAGVGCYAGMREMDMHGAMVVPGFIDGHIHLESSLLVPARFAECAVMHGTTAVVCDPHEIANVMGVKGIQYMLEATEGLPFDAFVMLPSCVPATAEDESFAPLERDDLEPLWNEPRVLGLAEMMNYPGVLNGDDNTLNKLVMAQEHHRPIDGHAPRLSGAELTAYIAAGIESDHECSTYEEGLEKLRQGQWIMIREGTAAQNLHALLPLLKGASAARCLFVTDDKHPAEMLRDGHIDGMVRMAIDGGADPLTALKAASWNAAAAFGLKQRGAIAPGYAADLAVLSSTYQVTATIKDGCMVYDGQTVTVHTPVVDTKLDELARCSFHLDEVTQAQFERSDELGVLSMVDGQIITTDGGMASGVDVSRDILKIAVLERHHHTGHVGIGYLKGYGLKHGAVATSVAHDSHNLIVIGENDSDMACAAECVRKSGGGITVARDGRILGELPLPIAGIMTDWDTKRVNDTLEELKRLAAELGVHEGVDPFMTLSFMSLPVIPAMRVLTHGVFDVNGWKYVSR